MAATILNSPRAVETSLYVVRAFVRLRELLASNAELALKLTELEHKLKGHDEAQARSNTASASMWCVCGNMSNTRATFSL